ncbi:MAG: MATE family efflux transporter [Acetatifactor muris]|nr:MATE family efflux transporter [Acetatifactor muris]MCM1527991.1 MATE family efflux transporter [Bacteroides sp.]
MKTEKKMNRELILNGSMLQAILSLAVPVVINSFLQTMYNLTDTYWLGKIGTNELAAINLVTPVQNIIINVGLGITVAGSVLIAQYIGGGEKDNAKSMANQIFACAGLFAIVCAAAVFLATSGIVSWLGADGDTYTHACTYLRIVIWDMPFLYMVNIFSAVHQAQGDTVRPMFLNLGGIILNMILDPLFMVGLHMGTAGAALATLLAKMVPAIVAFVLLSRRSDGVHLDLRHMRFEWEKIKLILRIGLPTAIGGSTMQLGFLLMSRNVYAYGDQAMAAYGIGNKVNGLITLPSNGIGSAVATIVGQNMGAKQTERAREGYLLSMKICIVFLFVGGMILSRDVISTGIVGIFSDDAEVVAMAADFLSIMAFWCFTNGVYNATTGLFQGTGHTEVTMAVDATRLWVFRFLTLWFCETILHMGVRSVWYSVVVSNGISSVILFVLYKSNIWKKSKIKVGSDDAQAEEAGA